jgi:hypothetical protein
MAIRPMKIDQAEVWVADGLEDALLGYGEQGQQTVAVYDYTKCVEILMRRDGMDQDEADEFMSYNVTGTSLAQHTPVFLERMTPEETDAIRRPAGWA